MTEVVKRDGYHHGALEAAALDGAMRIVQTQGAGALSMRGLACELGVAHRALYRHFADREALLAAVAAEGYRGLAKAVAGTDSRQAFACAYLRFALDQPRLYDVMLRARSGGSDPNLAAAVAAVIDHARRAIGTDRQVQRVWALLHGGLSLHAVGAMRARDPDALIGFLLTLLDED